MLRASNAKSRPDKKSSHASLGGIETSPPNVGKSTSRTSDTIKLSSKRSSSITVKASGKDKDAEKNSSTTSNIVPKNKNTAKKQLGVIPEERLKLKPGAGKIRSPL